MTDIMKLADNYARLNAQTTAPGAHEARAALQSAIEALQAENERLDKENTDSLVSLATAIQHRDGFRKQLDYHRHEMDDLEEDYSNLQAERDALQSKLDAMGKGEPVAHVYAIERTGRPLVAWDDARGIGLGDKLYTASETLTEVINKARIFGLGLPIVQTERLIKAIESLKESTP